MSYEFILKTAGHEKGEPRNNTTSLDIEKNDWYRVFKSTLEDKLKVKINPEIFPAATDGRYLREIGKN